jgi:adhesin/invasin
LVKVGNSSGEGVRGATVTFAVASGGGTITGETQTTNAVGIARLGGWTLGQTPGPNVLHVTVDGSTSILTINATATVGPIATFEKTAGDNQSATVGTAVATKPAVRLTDRFGNPISGAEIDFTVTGGGGFVTGEVQATNAQGIATIGSWTLGPTNGVNRLSAAIALWEYGGVPQPLEFTANGAEIQPSPHSGRQSHH